MNGFLVFTAFVVVMVMLFRYWRKREVEAFLEADLSAFEDLDLPALAGTTGFQPRPMASNVVRMPPEHSTEDLTPAFRLRDALFDEVHRDFLQVLEEVVGNDYRIFVHVPLSDFIGAEKGEDQNRLKDKTVSFLLCEASVLSVVCGIQLKGAGQTELQRAEFLEDVFRQLGRPFFAFPVLTRYSPMELREQLAQVLNESPLSRHCPKCGKQMMMRKAVKGRNAGKSFWVCREFPSCKGIMRIGG